MKNKDTFENGARVILNSGGPEMTVRAKEEKRGGKEEESPLYRVEFFWGCELRQQTFPRLIIDRS